MQLVQKHGLDLLEPDFFVHAERYLPDFMIRDWQGRKVTVDLSKFASLDQLVAHLDDIDIPVSGGFMIDLINFDGPKSLASTWDLDSPSVRDVPQELREVPFCERFHMPNMVRLPVFSSSGIRDLCSPIGETARRVVRAFSERLGPIDCIASLLFPSPSCLTGPYLPIVHRLRVMS